MAKNKQRNKTPTLSSILYFSLVFVLGIFAKDNIMSQAQQFLVPENMPSKTIVANEGTIEVAFSPNHGATASIVKAVKEARAKILVSAYSFTSMDIAKALLDAKNRNVKIKIILDKSQISARYSSSTFFAQKGFEHKIDVKHAIYHNKVMIIDDNTVITGSFNFTKAAENKNAENVLIIRNNRFLAKLYTDNWNEHWNKALSREDFLKANSRELRKNQKVVTFH